MKGLPLPVEVAVPFVWPAVCHVQRLVLHSARPFRQCLWQASGTSSGDTSDAV